VAVKTDIWMPLYIADYMGDTIGFSNSEHGAYLLALMAYWRKGESLTPTELKDICGKDVDRICRKFIMDANRWHHKRVDAELKKAYEAMKIKKSKAMKMVEARRKLGQI
jgi:uncharacterized protein YdaU (DUF1376 family)